MSTIREQRSLGIIGGLGVGATVHYYQSIVDACTAQGVAPRLFIAHADVARVLANVRNGGLVELARYLASFAESLAAAGADIELNLIFNDANTDFPAIDCARAHINGIIRHLAR